MSLPEPPAPGAPGVPPAPGGPRRGLPPLTAARPPAPPPAAVPPVAGGPSPDGRWRLARVGTAPHRLGFFAGGVAMAVIASWWAVVLSARLAGIAVPWAVAEPVAHGLAMALGFMPAFIVGFLFTAGPRWLALPDVPASSLRMPVLGLTVGWAVALAGFHGHAGLAAAGVGLAAAAWATLVLRFARLVRASRSPDRLHATVVAVACAVGVAAGAWAAVSLAGGDAAGARAAARVALWGFLAPVFATVSHRMLPFFTSSALPALDAWRPSWVLAAMLVPLAAGGLLDAVEAVRGDAPALLRAAVLAVQAPAAAGLAWLALRWGLVHSLRIRLLAMLHLGFVWLAVALGLSGAVQAWTLAGGDGASFALAPLHALSVGYLGTTLLAMATRVASGHSGRPLAADDVAWALYGGVQAAAMARVVAAVWPAAAGLAMPAAAVLWAVALAGWAWRYGGWMGRPRVDGRPG